MDINSIYIPPASGQVNSDWNALSGVAQILNKPDLTLYELIANKAIDFSTIDNSLYPTTLAVYNLVNAAIGGLNPMTSCEAATIGILPNSPSYNNGAGTLTSTVNAALVVDGYAVQTGDRILVKNQAGSTGAATNGVYDVTNQGSGATNWVLTRSSDYDTVPDINASGSLPVINGTVNGTTSWLLINHIATLGTDALLYVQFTLTPTLLALNNLTLAQFATTSSDQLRGIMSDATGNNTGAKLVFSKNPTLDGVTISDATNIALNTTTGTKIGTATNQKLAFFNATPVVQQSGNILTALTALGLVVSPTLSASDIPDISATYSVKAGNTSLVTVGTIGTGTWRGTPVADTYISSAATWNGKQAALAGTGIVKSSAGTISYISGTSGQFIKGDGTLDSSSYFTSITSTGGTLTISANNAEVNLSNANTWTATQACAFEESADAATITLDFSAKNNFRRQLTGNRTLGVPSNIKEGASGIINVWQDGTGSRTLAYAWCFMFSGGTAPTLSTGKYTLDQFAYFVNKYAASTVTISQAAPGIITWTGHGLLSGQKIQLTTTGTLPTGLTTATSYWVHVIDANTFHVSSNIANLQAGTYITTSSAGSGTHTATAISITLSLNANISNSA